MARRRRRKQPMSSRYARRGRTRSASYGWVRWVVLIVAVAAGAWLWPKFRPGAGAPAAVDIPEDAAALSDSVNAATQRQDWEGAVVWAQHLVKQHPKLSGAHRKLASAWHNYGVAGSGGDMPRSAQRTSLDRIGCELKTLAAADSARMLAATPQDYVSAMQLYAQALEYLGLPIDALIAFDDVLKNDPNHSLAAARAYWISEHLRDPLAPDRLEPR